MLKTHNCGELSSEQIGERVTLAGWLNRRRDHGGLIFIDLRDRWGITQVTIDSDVAPEAHATAAEARGEYVLQISGTVRERPEGFANPNLATGAIEVIADEVDDFEQRPKTPPFYVSGEDEGTSKSAENVDEALRLKYRYLDLRRPRMMQNLVLRHQIVRFIREYFSARDFLEIETPILLKSTPEGARDFIVPSRLHPARILRAAPKPAAAQAAADGGGRGALLPNCPLLPRRRPARGSPARIYPARS